MKLKAEQEVFRVMKDAEHPVTRGLSYYTSEVTVDIDRLGEKRAKELLTLLRLKLTEYELEEKHVKGFIYGIENWLEIKKVGGDAKVKKHQDLEAMFHEYFNGLLSEMPEGLSEVEEAEWVENTLRVYRKDRNNDDKYDPFIITNAKYEPPKGSGEYRSPGYVNLYYSRYSDGNVESMKKTWYYNDCVGKTVGVILQSSGFILPTDDLNERYKESIEHWKSVHDDRFAQYDGVGYTTGRLGHRSALDQGGKPARLLTDPEDNDKENRVTAEWKNAQTKKNPESRYTAPIQPMIRCFDLDRHGHRTIDTAFLTKHVFQTDIGDKLILPEVTRGITDIMMKRTDENFSDIITGKSEGVIVLSSGPPGVGKTLTAQVYSEVLEKPLYMVQASQLGMTPDKVETNLQKILNRAERWGCILMIDEADVYVHKRGSSMTQNAIVGMFLRYLETYRGILFMTTNIPDIVDDAIMSRCTAHIPYGIPTLDDQEAIWGVIAGDNGLKLGAGFRTKFVDKHPELSGRDVSQLVKLFKLYSGKQKKTIDHGTIEALMPYRPTPGVVPGE